MDKKQKEQMIIIGEEELHELYEKISKLYNECPVFRYAIIVVVICAALLLCYKLGVATGKFIR